MYTLARDLLSHNGLFVHRDPIRAAPCRRAAKKLTSPPPKTDRRAAAAADL